MPVWNTVGVILAPKGPFLDHFLNFGAFLTPSLENLQMIQMPKKYDIDERKAELVLVILINPEVYTS